MTWPDRVKNRLKFCKRCRIRYAKFQPDSPSASAASSEKLMRGCIPPPVPVSVKSTVSAPEVMCMYKHVFGKKYYCESFLALTNKNIYMTFFSSKSYRIHLSRKLFETFQLMTIFDGFSPGQCDQSILNLYQPMCFDSISTYASFSYYPVSRFGQSERGLQISIENSSPKI